MWSYYGKMSKVIIVHLILFAAVIGTYGGIKVYWNIWIILNK